MNETITAILKLAEDCLELLDEEKNSYIIDRDGFSVSHAEMLGRRDEIEAIKLRLQQLKAELHLKAMYTYIERLPALVAWLKELGRQPGDVESMSMGRDAIRDYKREAREKSIWAYFIPGKLVTVTLTLTDKSVHVREFERLDWIA